MIDFIGNILMDNRSWMYWELIDGLYRQDFLKVLGIFINFEPFNPKNISDNKIRCLCVKCKDKKLHHKDVILEKNT